MTTKLTDRLYLRPTAFVDGPSARARQLAGGACWFTAVEVIAREGGRRVRQEFVPVDSFDETALAPLTIPRLPLAIGASTVTLDRPRTMAILNLTPDSFSDGGRLGGGGAGVAAGLRMLADGAALLDLGGESTRPGAAEVAAEEEIARILPAVAGLAAAGAPVAIDTRKAAVMSAALDAGAGLVNDVSALLHDPAALALVAARGCPVVLMHHQGTPATMQRDPRYADVLLDVYDWLEARILACEAAGISRTRILIDPGIGFGKTPAHNAALVNGLSLLHGLGCGIVLGASRKRTIPALAGRDAPVEHRLGGSLALALSGAAQGVQLLRVHDAFETAQALAVWQGLRDRAFGGGQPIE